MAVYYKHKPNKHKFRVNNKTIDEMHREHLKKFQANRDTIPQKKIKLDHLKDELESIKEKTSNVPINIDMKSLKKRKMIEKNIKKIEREINDAENYTEEMDYYGKIGDIVYDYYDITNGMLYNNIFDLQPNQIENQKNTDKVKISNELLEITNSNKTKKIKKPVKKRNNKHDIKPAKTVMNYLIGHDIKNETINKASLQDEYLMIIDKDYACTKLKTGSMQKCSDCGVYKLIIYAESIMACPKCGSSDHVIVECDTSSHKEVYNEKRKYPYKRIGHCIEKLNQFLCKGTPNIPPEIFGILEDEISKHGLQKNQITTIFLEKMLKKHMLSEHYENSMYIYSKMTNTPPLTVTREEYELVLQMFLAADKVYEEKFKPKTRINFFKYTVVLNKIFIKIGKHEHAKHFKLLKNPNKMKETEKIWKLICEQLERDKVPGFTT